MPNFDVVIIGSGIAALTAAYQLSSKRNVIILTKSKRTTSNSYLAQGGIASCFGKDDTWHSHFADTITAGCQHNRENIVEMLVKNGPSFIAKLIKDGMKFDFDETGDIHLGKEGAHTTRRILHAGGDATGRELVLHMLDKVKDSVPFIEDEIAIDFIFNRNQCVGVETMDDDGTVKPYFASAIILATGGCGGLYTFHSNDEETTGDGLAMAYRAGAELTDLEFIQFHPTLLNHNGKGTGLISEAVRGEGAKLVNEDGKRIMKKVHPLEELAPRDVVARTIFYEMQLGKKVYLDISMISNFKTHFPTISRMCAAYINEGFIPVIPGAHFSMGGVKTDGFGRTSIHQLYAIGEVACTGVHGANRLASNSLLEGIVFGNLVADDILSIRNVPAYVQNERCRNVPQVLNLPTKEQIQQMMMENVGIVRNKDSLRIAVEWFKNYKEMYDGCSFSTVNKEQLVLINMITVGWLIATSALMRTESRGAHFREDFPDRDEQNWHKEELLRTNQIEKVLHPIT